MPKAAGLAEAVKGRFQVEPRLIAGGGGIFDVHVDGTRVWSKHETGRFPEHQEVLDRMAEVLSRA